MQNNNQTNRGEIQNTPRKRINFDKIVFVISLIAFSLIFYALCLAVKNLQERGKFHSHGLAPKQTSISDEVEKPLVFDGMFLDDSQS